MDEREERIINGVWLSDRLFKKIVISLVVILFIICTFLVSYYYVFNNSLSGTTKQIRSNLTSINNINKALSSFGRGQTLDITKLKKELETRVPEFTEVKESLEKSLPLDSSKDRDKLLSGVNSNLLMYRQLLAILSNPEGKDVGKSLEHLKQYRDDCVNAYTLVHSRPLKLTLPEKVTTLINHTSDYFSEFIKVNRDREIINIQNKDYVDNMEEMVNQFITIKTSVYTFLHKANENTSSPFNTVLTHIDKNLDETSLLKSDFLKLSIPANAIASSDTFKITLDHYESYLDHLKLAVSTEKMKAMGHTLPKIPEDIISSTVKPDVEELNAAFNEFISAYTEFKTVNIK